MSLLVLPFPLPPAFLERLGYHHDRRIVGVHFEPVLDEVEFTDGVRGLIGADRYVYWELARLPLHPSWAGWLWERAREVGEAAALGWVRPGGVPLRARSLGARDRPGEPDPARHARAHRARAARADAGSLTGR